MSTGHLGGEGQGSGCLVRGIFGQKQTDLRGENVNMSTAAQ